MLFLAIEPDHWRSSRVAPFRHMTDKDHEIDLEALAAAGIDPATVTSFSSDFLVQFMASKAAPPLPAAEQSVEGLPTSSMLAGFALP